MKKKFFRSCFALLLSMVLLFGGVRWDAAAIGDVSPFGPVLPPSAVIFDVSAPQAVIAKGEKVRLTYSATPSGGSITWSSNSNSIATVSSSGVVSAIGTGKVNITGRYTYSGTNYTSTVSIWVYDSVGIMNSTDYYIMNYSNDRLMARETNTYTSTTDIATVTFSSASRAKWRTVKQSNGSFRLLSIDGTNNNRYLGVSGSDAILTTGSFLFTFNRITSGTYEGLYIIKYGNQYLSQNSSYDVCLTSSLSSSCYWSVMKVNKGDAELYGFNYTYGNPTSPSTFCSIGGFNELESSLDNLGYDAVQKTNETYSNSYYSMSSDDIYIYVGHATYGMITFHGKNTNAQDVITGAIVAHNAITAVPSNSLFVNNMGDNALSGARCIFYLGCLSGAPAYINTSQSYNLVDETFDQGAHFVLGAIANIIDGNTTDWLIAFAESVQAGNNLESSINYANNSLEMYTYDVGETGNTITCKGLPLYTRGDDKQYLNLQ